MGTGTFERLAAEGAAHVLAGSHARESTPVEGGSRWSVSCLLLPGDELAAELDAVTTEASRLTGDSHWRTGARGFAHVTVRALEHHRAQVPSGDETVARYAAALRRAAARCGPVSLRVDGLILTPATLMACATQVDGSADRPTGWPTRSPRSSARTAGARAASGATSGTPTCCTSAATWPTRGLSSTGSPPVATCRWGR
jgi:hypothetical protein